MSINQKQNTLKAEYIHNNISYGATLAKTEINRLKNKVNRMVRHHYELYDTAQDEIKELRRWKKWFSSYDGGSHYICPGCDGLCAGADQYECPDEPSYNEDGDEICNDCANDIEFQMDEQREMMKELMEELIEVRDGNKVLLGFEDWDGDQIHYTLPGCGWVTINMVSTFI